MEIIKINNVSKNYKNIKALNNINLSINEGELYGLLGVNGAGKTTLLKILSGLTNQTSGDFIVDGFTNKNMDEIKQILRDEINYKGVSVIIPRRECIQTHARKLRQAKK